MRGLAGTQGEFKKNGLKKDIYSYIIPIKSNKNREE